MVYGVRSESTVNDINNVKHELAALLKTYCSRHFLPEILIKYESGSFAFVHGDKTSQCWIRIAESKFYLGINTMKAILLHELGHYCQYMWERDDLTPHQKEFMADRETKKFNLDSALVNYFTWLKNDYKQRGLDDRDSATHPSFRRRIDALITA